MPKWSGLIITMSTVIVGLIGLSKPLVTRAASCPQVVFAIVEAHSSPVTRTVKVGTHQTIFVRRVPITKTSDIVDIKLGGNDYDAELQLKFTSAATKRLIDATNNHAGRRIAFMFNDEVLLNAVIPGSNGFDAEGAQVSIRHGMTIARKLMNAMRGCTGATAVTPAH